MRRCVELSRRYSSRYRSDSANVDSTLAGDGFGKLAPSTPQPPLQKMSPANWNVQESLFRQSLLKSLYPRWTGAKSGVTSAGNTEIPGVVRQQGSTLTLAGNGENAGN